MSSGTSVKAEARALIERLPETATWDDVMYEVCFRQAVEAGVADADAGRLTPHEEVRKRVQAFLHQSR